MRHKIPTALDFEVAFDKDSKKVLVVERAMSSTEDGYEKLPSSLYFHRTSDDDPQKEAKSVIAMFAISLYLVGEVGIPYEEVHKEFSKVPEFAAFDMSPYSRLHSEELIDMRDRLQEANMSNLARLM